MTERVAAILGAGVIGAGWAARFALMGWNVRVFDPSETAPARVASTMDRARASLPALYDVGLPVAGAISFHRTVSDAVAGATWIQESAPERLALKRKLYQRVQADCDPAAIVAASSPGVAMADLQGCATRPAQIIAARPCDPVYLIPLVGLEGAAGAVARAADILRGVGMAQDTVAAGSALRDVAASEADDTTTRDGHIGAMLRALKTRDHPAGTALAQHQAMIAPTSPDPDLPSAPVTLDRQVPVTWVDYNGHMNEQHYLSVFSDATDTLLHWAGMDAACVAQGHSVFTVETHIRHLAEVQIGDRIRATTRVIAGGGKKLHLWHDVYVGDRPCATGEQLLLHVDLATRRSALPRSDVGDWLARAAAAHAIMPWPDGFGRFVGQRSQA
jgi:carnitine 3-dehydrogenase